MKLKDLQILNENLEEIKSKSQEAKALRKVLLDKLKKEYNVNSLEGAKEKIEELTEEKEKGGKLLEKKYKKLISNLKEDNLLEEEDD